MNTALVKLIGLLHFLIHFQTGFSFSSFKTDVLKLFYSSDLYSLADSLHSELTTEAPENPLVPEIFVVQNYGMARWLSLYIARREGIAANLEFKFPAELYWQIMRVMDPNIPENLSSERIPMSWTIFEILQHDNDLALSKLQQYVRRDDPDKQEMRCWHLASRIADVYDQYLTYRPKMLREWEKEGEADLFTDFQAEFWQSHLWRKLNALWNKRNDNTGTHRAAFDKRLIDKIDKKEISADKLPPRISIFGVSEMPEMYIKTFVRLSKLTDVHFYTVDVAANTKNILIQSLGKVGKEFKSLLKKHIKEDEKLSDIHSQELNSNQLARDNFFQIVKHDLITSNSPENTVQPDDSIQFHSCHSPRREVEVLYDGLLSMLDENEKIEPSDVLVVCPQMDEYGPEIEAIFGAVEEGLPLIPYHLAETPSEANVVDLAFKKILQIVDSRFKVTDLLDLLDSKPIRQAFSFTNENVNTLEQWIEDNNIRWGISGDHKLLLDLPPTDSFTWRSGLNRMVAGYAMQTVDDTLFKQIYPYDEIQQTEHTQLLGRFSRFLNQLFAFHHQTKTKKTLAAWREILNDWLSSFFPDEEEFFRDTQKLREIVHALQEQQELAGVTSKISFRIIRSYLEDQLDQKATAGGRPGKGVTFSSMVPMRNIPAKVICMIGMNDGVFPRSKNSVEFNLITQNPREGDRLPSKEDRQIFIEHLLAAQHQVYFSYVGQSNKKEVEFPPSVVVREFVDYLVDHYNIDNDRIVQKHKLQSFSPLYFKKDRNKALFSYSDTNRNIALQIYETDGANPAFLDQDLPEPDKTFKNLSIGEFISFFQHPSRFLLQQRLGIYLYEEEVLDEDREAFDLNPLEKYQIGQEMMERFLAGKSLRAYKDAAHSKDLLPEGWPGDRAYNAQAHQVKEFGVQLQQILNQRELETVEVDFRSDDFQIVGRLNQVYENEQVLYRFGKMRPKDLIELWIKHLLFQTAKPKGHTGKTRLYTHDQKKGVDVHQFIALPDAEQILSNLLKMYWTGLQRNIMFYPKSSFAFAEKAILKNNNEEYALKAADRRWVDRYGGYPKEGDDAYNKCLIGNINPMEHKHLKGSFVNISRYFWTPFFRELNRQERG